MRYDPEKVCERILKQIRRYSEREGLTMSSLAREAGPPIAGSESLQCSAGVEAEESEGIHRDDCGL